MRARRSPGDSSLGGSGTSLSLEGFGIPIPRDTQSVGLKVEFLAKIDHARSRMRSITARLRKRPTDSRDYDRQTVAVMERVLCATSNCIDIGASAGELLKHMV